MKDVIDLEGNKIQVPVDTPCHPGVNGGLPRPYDAVIDADIFADMAEKKAIRLAEAPERALAAVITARNKERGTWEDQMEYFIDNGYDALKQRDDDIKLRHPKP